MEIGLALIYEYRAFRGGSVKNRQFEVLRIVLVLAGGGIGAIFHDSLDLAVKAGTRLALRAGDALAVFVVLYFWPSAHWQLTPSKHYTGGPGSPIPSGSGNIAVCNVPVEQ